MQKRNYHRELEDIIKQIDEKSVPRLLLHSCCGPCSSYVLEYLSQYFEITVFYYNPNIYPSEEYYYRVDEQQKIIDITDSKHKISMVTGQYDTDRFYETVRGMENLPEGGERCFRCYEMRLREAAKLASKEGFDYFTTTLSISPHKSTQKLNEIGEIVASEEGVRHLPGDFKKNNGYKRSCEITQQHGFYRQDYCGCIYSKIEKERREVEKKARENAEKRISEEKKNLRNIIKEKKKKLKKEYIKEADSIIYTKTIENEKYKDSRCVFIYVSRDNEVDTWKIIKNCFENGKKVCVPVCVDDRKMVAVEITSLEELVKTDYGLFEPEYNEKKIISPLDIDIAIVPCCTCDDNGNRLGYGKGYYDRYLAGVDRKRAKHKLPKVEKTVLLWKIIKSDYVPVGERDVQIDNLITD